MMLHVPAAHETFHNLLGNAAGMQVGQLAYAGQPGYQFPAGAHPSQPQARGYCLGAGAEINHMSVLVH